MHRGKKEIFKYFGTKFRERKRNRDGEKAAPKLRNDSVCKVLNRGAGTDINDMIVEVERSYTQFAEAITSLNIGEGTFVELCPYSDRQKVMRWEMDEATRDLVRQLEKRLEEIEKLLDEKRVLIIVYCTKFMGYTKNEDGDLVIVPEEAEVVKLIFCLYLEGYGIGKIAKHLEEQGIKTATGQDKWHSTVIDKMLRNEKHMGDALLQKNYTVDFMTKKKVKNTGIVPLYYVEDDHEAIIPKELFRMGRKR